MKTEDIKKMALAWAAVQEASKKKMEKMDPVGQEDDDIDNDGDTDKSDEYLNKRRKAISKAVKKDDEAEIVMNPKETQKESVISIPRPRVYARILEARAERYKSAAPADEMDKGQSPGGKKMKADLGNSVNDDDIKGADDAAKAGRATKKSAARTGDNAIGDKNVVNPVKDTTK